MAVNLNELYDIIEYINEGSYGYVYKIKDKVEQKSYALKLICKKNIKYLIRETKPHTMLDKPYMFINSLRQNYSNASIKMPDGSKYENVRALIYDFIDGVDFDDLMFDRELREVLEDEQEVYKFVIQLFLGLFALHSHGMVHNDVKLENIMYDAHSGDLNIIDLGMVTYSNEKKAGDFRFETSGSLRIEAPEIYSIFLAHREDMFNEFEHLSSSEFDRKMKEREKFVKKNYPKLLDERFLMSPSRDVYNAGILAWMIINRGKLERSDVWQRSFKFKYDADPVLKSVVLDCLKLDPPDRPTMKQALIRLGLTNDELNEYNETGFIEIDNILERIFPIE